MDLDTFYAKTTMYVRPTQTLVLATIGRRVGGPGSGLWGSGWRLGVGGSAFTDLAMPDVHHALMARWLDGDDVRIISPENRAAWIRTWQGPGVIR